MGINENIDLVGRGFAAFNAADVNALAELLSPDVVHHIPGSHPLAGVHKGLENVLGMFGKVGEMSGGTFRVEPTHLLSDGGDRVLALCRYTGDRPDGRSLALDQAVLFTIADGKVTMLEDFGDVEANNAFWGD